MALDSQERTVSKISRTGLLGQGMQDECWERKAGVGQLGQESLGQESLGRTARTGQPENVGMVQAGQEREDRMART
jgi:hypothetical protein